MELALMPAVLVSLLSAEQLLTALVSVMEWFFLELMAGCCGFTLGCLLNDVPCIKPWDVRFGEAFCVLKGEQVLFKVFRSGRVAPVHFGSFCRTNSMAKSPALRDADQVHGKNDLTEAQKELLLGNDLCDFTVGAVWTRYWAGRYFSIGALGFHGSEGCRCS
jgi:hypothetical protein